MQCPTCGNTNHTRAVFSVGCGALLMDSVVCNNCQTILPPQARFCYHCSVYVAPACGTQSGAAIPIYIDQSLYEPAQASLQDALEARKQIPKNERVISYYHC